MVSQSMLTLGGFLRDLRFPPAFRIGMLYCMLCWWLDPLEISLTTLRVIRGVSLNKVIIITLKVTECFILFSQMRTKIMKTGLTNRATDAGTFNEQIFFIDGLYLPKQHDFYDFDYDIALLHVAGRIALNPYVRTVCLPPVPQPGENTSKCCSIVIRNSSTRQTKILFFTACFSTRPLLSHIQ